MKWLWTNTTQVGFGENVVQEHLKKFVQPKSKVLVTFGGGSIDKNGARADVTKALAELECEVRWEGGIPPNPEYDRLIEIAQVVREWKPDLLLAVGGGSTLDGTKFLSLAAALDPSNEPWDIITKHTLPETCTPIGSVMTLPATGSEWNSSFVISRRSTNDKLEYDSQLTFPKFSLLDPKYTMTLPTRQLRNGIFDAMCHCIDQFLTPQVVPMMDNFWLSVMRELVDISLDLLKPDSSLELHGRLVVAATFALNLVFTLGKNTCWGIHQIGHQLTAEYGIDHGATLAMVTIPFLRHFKKEREFNLARSAERVFDIREGSDEEKATKFIERLQEWIISIGHVKTVSECDHAKLPIKEGDLEKLIKMVMVANGNGPFGYHKSITEADVTAILKEVIV
ncbi:alcohol dehydrogenase, iron-containing family protein [Trichomonas vaginalis G3]|uniref:Alcohol dehydrogenase, iron-containing family protein n=1 Tax=Trichomonas vaginalis (strain ATCC PRA-98 / G3) TaxID=412133 RepID=A2EBD3_TRIV3|nr:alcohol dehydrogenase YQHD family [Trichomonas vaginalis G3]EAY10078.1 alcohol dehydrogenase, iron-containing family protein [Trichomonas vaginalis G3]KAI5528471.1 alcohol dehydrogenase YQHD family [Trichomonas vaginalis G3]|eukprot:XP_001322301.1 alcohol dehydrogenase, iron-containing family protein [Trichomonas vaginalis G3]